MELFILIVLIYLIYKIFSGKGDSSSNRLNNVRSAITNDVETGQASYLRSDWFYAQRDNVFQRKSLEDIFHDSLFNKVCFTVKGTDDVYFRHHFGTPESLFSAGSLIEKIFPDNQRSHLEVMQCDDKTYNFDGLFAKPDAVIIDPKSCIAFVAELKSKECNNMKHNLKNLLQVVICCHVIDKQKKALGIDNYNLLPVIRYSDAIIEIRGWKELSERIELFKKHYMKLNCVSEVSSSELAEFLAIVDLRFGYKPKNKEEAQLRGNSLHEIVLTN